MLKNEFPSYEEFLETYEYDEKVSRGYHTEIDYRIFHEISYNGPCQNKLCGCRCRNIICECEKSRVSIYIKDCEEFGNAEVSLSKNWDDGYSTDVSFSIYSNSKHDGELKIGNFSVGFDMTRVGGNARLEANIAEFKTNGLEAKVGINFETGCKISSDGIELNTGFVGVSIGKKIGLSTIFGGVSLDTRSCNVQ